MLISPMRVSRKPIGDVFLFFCIQILGDAAAVFLVLANTFRQQIFDLSVDGAKIFLRPAGQGGKQLR